MPTATLFTADDLTDWLRQPVTEEAASVVERVVWGWVRPVLNVTERPEPISPELTSAAIELGGIAYSNPEGLSSYSLEAESSSYSSERRDEILATIGNGGLTPATGSVPAPTGNFPCARPYPDPAERW